MAKMWQKYDKILAGIQWVVMCLLIFSSSSCAFTALDPALQPALYVVAAVDAAYTVASQL